MSLLSWGSFVEVVEWEYSGRCWILFAEDSDKRPSTSLPLAPSASTTTTTTTITNTPHRCSCALRATSFSPHHTSLVPLRRRSRNVTSISSSGPTRHLHQPSEGASGDCNSTNTTTIVTTTAAYHRLVRYVYVWDRRWWEETRARAEKRLGRRRLDVSRPHVIPSYSTLSVRTANELLLHGEYTSAPFLYDFAPVKNRYCPQSFEMTFLSRVTFPFELFDNFSYLSLYQSICVHSTSRLLSPISSRYGDVCVISWLINENKFHSMQILCKSMTYYLYMINYNNYLDYVIWRCILSYSHVYLWNRNLN